MAKNDLIPPTLEEDQIQRIIISGYGHLPYGSLKVVCIDESEAARAWLEKVSPLISYGGPLESPVRFNLAFTRRGFERLGLPEITVEKFSPEFKSGALESRRLRVLGDTGDSSPDKWSWGKDENRLHLLLLTYGKTLKDLNALDEELALDPEAFTVLHELPSHVREGGKDHFGFKDGIVQPIIAGRKRVGHKDNTIPAGEFILGYPNARKDYPPSPAVSKDRDRHDILPENVAKPGSKDFGRNGSYLVYRQLAQDVEAFWEFSKKASEKFPDPKRDATWVASKMVGRWPDGASLALSPDKNDPDLVEGDENYFKYTTLDPDGQHCPFGSHVRRSNPRDCLYPNAEKSTSFTNFHRIIRRGRSYETEDKERGLNFICFNASIENQFEFIQHEWLNNPKFADKLYQDSDPISGVQDLKHPEATGTFTIPCQPVRTRVHGLPRFVHVRGSGYFFMPGRAAIEYLNRLVPEYRF